MAARSNDEARDRALLDCIRTGDQDAHRQLFELYYPKLFAFARRRLADPELTEDVVVDVFYEVWRQADRFRGASRVSTWIFGIAHFKCLHTNRQTRRIREVPLPDNVAEIHVSEVDPSREVGARAELERLLAVLSPECREVVELAFVRGLSHSEISKELGVPLGTVKSRMSRARNRLERERHSQEEAST